MTMAVGAIIGAGISLYTGLKSASLQKKALRAQEKQQELADRQAKQRLLRQSQIAAGQTVNFAANVGALGSSGLQGGVMNLNNQVASQIGYQTQSSALAKQASGLMQQASNYQMFGDLFGPMFGRMNLGTVGYNQGTGFGYTLPT